MADWREHYQRMKRSRARLNTEWNTQSERPEGIESVRDAFYGFFQTCYHLVDWLENDPSQPIRRQEADQFVRASATLSFCHDLCQGSKHARLEPKGIDALRPEPQVISELPILDASGTKVAVLQFIAAEMTVVRSAGNVNAFDLADDCIAEWERFLVSRGLVLPERGIV